MNEHPSKVDSFEILKTLSSSDSVSQRDLSARVGFSLDKTNYPLKTLVKHELIPVKNFSNHNGKLNKVRDILTKEDFNARLQLTYHFLKRNEHEYNQINIEWNALINTQPFDKKNIRNA